MSELPTPQVNEQALKPNHVVEQVGRERALAITQAANEVGARVVALANEGETFYNDPKSSSLSRREITVKPGNIAIRTSGEFPDGDMGAMNRRADQIQQQMQAEQEQNPAA